MRSSSELYATPEDALLLYVLRELFFDHRLTGLYSRDFLYSSLYCALAVRLCVAFSRSSKLVGSHRDVRVYLKIFPS